MNISPLCDHYKVDDLELIDKDTTSELYMKVFIYLFIYLFITVFIYLCIFLFIYLCIYVFIFLFIYVFWDGHPLSN